MSKEENAIHFLPLPVILPIDEYLELLEDLDDLAIIAERREEPTIPQNVVMEDLRNNGYLPD